MTRKNSILSDIDRAEMHRNRANAEQVISEDRDVRRQNAAIKTTVRFERLGKGKQTRWIIALHEAAHGLAAAHFGVSSRLFLSRARGLCVPSSNPFTRGQTAIYMLAGNITRLWPIAWPCECGIVPRGRVKSKGRWTRRFRKITSDRQQVENIREASEVLRDDAELFDVAYENWLRQARRFALNHLAEIVEVATRLYIAGRAGVPAKTKQTEGPVELLPAEIKPIAARAAERIS